MFHEELLYNDLKQLFLNELESLSAGTGRKLRMASAKIPPAPRIRFASHKLINRIDVINMKIKAKDDESR